LRVRAELREFFEVLVNARGVHADVGGLSGSGEASESEKSSQSHSGEVYDERCEWRVVSGGWCVVG
jgi:hypothetical protein